MWHFAKIGGISFGKMAKHTLGWPLKLAKHVTMLNYSGFRLDLT